MSFMPARQGRFISAAELAEAEAAMKRVPKPPRRQPLRHRKALPNRAAAAPRRCAGGGKGRALRPNPSHNPRLPPPT